MRITRIDSQLLRIPLEKSIPLSVAGKATIPRPAVTVLLVQVETDGGMTGVGFGCFADGGRSLLAAIEDDITPLLVGENALHHERLWAKVHTLESAAAHSAYATIDVALWDLKGKAAGSPLWKLLGGVRESAKCFTAETAGACTAADAVIAAGRDAIAKGIGGVRVSLAGVDPKAESDKLVTIHDALGEDIWYAVTIERPYDYETALPMGRFIEEEIGADWLENPLADDDLQSYARLSSRIDTPLAAGGRFTSTGQFVRLLECGAPVTFRPDVIRVGGLTPWLKVASLAELNRRPVSPRLLPEIGMHLACGLPGVQAVEYVPWLSSLFVEPVRLTDGNLVPPAGPGLGLVLNADSVGKYALSAR
jgi:L-alanine-DL-glutamate epimerase-like enolase superfamily enzyme